MELLDREIAKRQAHLARILGQDLGNNGLGRPAMRNEPGLNKGTQVFFVDLLSRDQGHGVP